MKSLIRNFVFFSVSLFLLPLLIQGATVRGGIGTVFIGALTMTFLFTFVKPVLSIITFPLNLITLGFFSFLVNMFLLYLLTVFIPSIKIAAFVFTSVHFAGFVIPTLHINVFFAYAVSALFLYAVTSVLAWLTR